MYLNLDQKAMCSGTVYGWRYCFDPDDGEENELVLAMYRRQPNNKISTDTRKLLRADTGTL